MFVGVDVPGIVLSSGSMTWLPLFSTGSRWVRFPDFVDRMGSSDSMTSFPPRFVAFAWQY